MFTGELFPFQKEAFDRMVERRKVLLAYEQGTGKTVLAIAAIEHLMEQGVIQYPVLVVALSSLKYQWAAEIEKFSDSRPLVIDGPPKKRMEQYGQMHGWFDNGVDYVIVNYEQVVNDWGVISAMTWGALIADEATALKGFRSKRSKAVKKLSQVIPVRFALTGTPIENGKPEELFSIMQMVDPKVLGKFDLFDRTFIVRNQWGWVDRYRNLPTLYNTMSEVMVRKRQTDPEVQEYMPVLRRRPPILVSLDPSTRRLYERIRVDLLASLDDAAELMGASGFSLDAHYGLAPSPNDPAGAVKGKIMSQITALRMCSGNADLIRQSAVQFKESMNSGAATMKGSAYAAELHDDGLLINLPKTPAKAKKVVEFVRDFLDLDPRHKVVIFSSFLGTVDMLQGMLGDQAERYTGAMNAKAKEQARQAFKTRDDIRVLISSDAGGYGVDLPEGNLLINYDLPWKAGTASQRDSRIIRASSEWEHVHVDNFLVADSIEGRQYEMLQQKHRVAEAVVDGRWINDKGGVDLTLGTLKEFLSHP